MEKPVYEDALNLSDFESFPESYSQVSDIPLTKREFRSKYSYYMAKQAALDVSSSSESFYSIAVRNSQKYEKSILGKNFMDKGISDKIVLDRSDLDREIFELTISEKSSVEKSLQNHSFLQRKLVDNNNQSKDNSRRDCSESSLSSNPSVVRNPTQMDFQVKSVKKIRLSCPPTMSVALYSPTNTRQQNPVVKVEDTPMLASFSLSFLEAVGIFKTIKLKNMKTLWTNSTFCSCFGNKYELSSKNTELITKLVNFVDAPFSLTDSYHSDLLNSVLVKAGLGGIASVDLNLPLDTFTQHNDEGICLLSALSKPGSTLAMLFLLFIIDYFPRQTKVYFTDCPVFIVLLLLVKPFTELLAKKDAKKLLSKSDQPLEVCFFLFAGVLQKWFQVYENGFSWTQRHNVTKKTMAIASSKTVEILQLAVNDHS